MPIIIKKNTGANTSIYTINNFTSLSMRGSSPIDDIADPISTVQGAILSKAYGPTLMIEVEWIITDEPSSVVAGIGAPVTTAIEQQQYLYDSFLSQGSEQITDYYFISIDYGNGVTFDKLGFVESIDVSMSSDQPLTFKGYMRFKVGTVL